MPANGGFRGACNEPSQGPGQGAIRGFFSSKVQITRSPRWVTTRKFHRNLQGGSELILKNNPPRNFFFGMASKSARAGTAIDLESGRKRLSSTLSPIDGTAPAKQPAKKRRSREAANLGVTRGEERYLPETSKVWFARQQRNWKPAVSKKKAANAAQESWAAFREWQAECVTLDEDQNIHISIELGEAKLASLITGPKTQSGA